MFKKLLFNFSKKIKSVDKKSLIMLASGVVLMIVSIGIFVFTNMKETKAVDTGGHDWAEEWKATKMGAVDLYNIAAQANRGTLCLGPWQWQTNGTIDNQNYTETWDAWLTSTYGDYGDLTELNHILASNTGSSAGNKVNVTWHGTVDWPAGINTCSSWVDASDNAGNRSKIFHPAGLYGLMWTDQDGTDANNWPEWGGMAWYPKSWRVTGDFQ